MPKSDDHIILFDGVCNLCNGIVNFLIRKDKKQIFKFAPLQSEAGKSILTTLNMSVDQRDTFVYVRKGKAYIKSTAGLYVMKDLGSLRKVLFIFIYIPKFLRDPVYEVIAKLRYKLWGRKETCMVPTDDVLSRFLQ